MTEQTFKESADIYRRLRKNGITLKNQMDVYIAAVAIEHDVLFLCDDRDFTLIAQEFPLKVMPKT